jgi:hypothetical protein
MPSRFSCFSKLARSLARRQASFTSTTPLWTTGTVADEPEPPSDDRAEPVGADDKRATHLVRPALVTHDDAGGPALCAKESGHRGALDHPGAVVARAVEQERVEDRPAQREPMVAKATEAMGPGKLAHERRPVRRVDPHPGQARRPRTFHRLEGPELLQQARGLGAEVLGARLVPRETGLVEHQHVEAGPSEKARRRRAGRSTSDDDGLGVEGAQSRQFTTRRNVSPDSVSSSPTTPA